MLKHIRKLLKDDRLSITLAHIPARKEADAHTKWSTGKPIRITVDPARVGVVRAVVHELLHVLLEGPMYAYDEDTEETLIVALEEDLYSAIVSEDNLADYEALIQARITPSPGSGTMRPSPKTPAAKRKIQKTMSEFSAGTLHSSSEQGPLVENRKQAVAIALSQARKAKSRRTPS